MSKTYQFDLPMLQASQAQKHVTVNESVAMLDALAQLRFVSRSLSIPPTSPVDGEAYFVASSGTGDWAGQGDRIAIFSNGGWIYLDAKVGWQAWIEDESGAFRFDGSNWVALGGFGDPVGEGGTQARTLEFDHEITAGATNQTLVPIPSHASVFGVSGRVIEAVDATSANSWKIGVSGSDNRYGDSYGLAFNSYALGMSGQPQTYYSDTPLLLTATGGGFVSGKIRLRIHYVALTPPNAV
jgi:hypothetical protein